MDEIRPAIALRFGEKESGHEEAKECRDNLHPFEHRHMRRISLQRFFAEHGRVVHIEAVVFEKKCEPELTKR